MLVHLELRRHPIIDRWWHQAFEFESFQYPSYQPRRPGDGLISLELNQKTLDVVPTGGPDSGVLARRVAPRLDGDIAFDLRFAGPKLGFASRYWRDAAKYEHNTSWLWFSSFEDQFVEMKFGEGGDRWHFGFFHRKHGSGQKRCQVSCGDSPATKEDCIECRIGEIVSQTCC